MALHEDSNCRIPRYIGTYYLCMSTIYTDTCLETAGGRSQTKVGTTLFSFALSVRLSPFFFVFFSPHFKPILSSSPLPWPWVDILYVTDTYIRVSAILLTLELSRGGSNTLFQLSHAREYRVPAPRGRIASFVSTYAY